MSLYYPGYVRTGDLVSSFGGGNPMYYQVGDTIEAGMTGDTFRTFSQRPFPLHNSIIGALRTRITSYNVCYTKLLRKAGRISSTEKILLNSVRRCSSSMPLLCLIALRI